MTYKHHHSLNSTYAEQDLDNIEFEETIFRVKESINKLEKKTNEDLTNEVNILTSSIAQSAQTAHQELQNFVSEIEQNITEISGHIDTEVTAVNNKLNNAVATLNNTVNLAENRVNTRVDNIIVNSSSTQDNSELIDIRTGTNGTTYNSAGEAIRTQFNSLNTTYNNIQESIGTCFKDISNSLVWYNNGFYNIYGRLIEDSNATYTVLPVEKGEKYRIKGYNQYYLSFYCLKEAIDSMNNQVVYPTETTNSKTLREETVEIPDNIHYMILSQWNSWNLENFSIEKLCLNEYSTLNNKVEHINENLSDMNDRLNTIDKTYEVEKLKDLIASEQQKNDFAWGELDGLYCTMTFDDTNSDIDILEDLAEELEIPLCFATIPSKLNILTSNGIETATEVLNRAVSNGGEILSHWGRQLNSQSSEQDYYDVYINSKKELENAGFVINGIITAGGGTDGSPLSFKTQDWKKDIELARLYYKYADLTANNYQEDLTDIEQYYNPRTFTDMGLDAVKARIDSIASTGTGWLNLASHGTNHVNTPNVDTFRQIFQYAISKGFKFATWHDMYTKFKSSKLNKKHTQEQKTISNNYFTEPIIFDKIGNIIMVSFRDNTIAVNISSNWIIIGNAPFKPINTVTIPIYAYKQEGIMVIETNGSISVYFSSPKTVGSEISLSGIYLTN